MVHSRLYAAVEFVVQADKEPVIDGGLLIDALCWPLAKSDITGKYRPRAWHSNNWLLIISRIEQKIPAHIYRLAGSDENWRYMRNGIVASSM